VLSRSITSKNDQNVNIRKRSGELCFTDDAGSPSGSKDYQEEGRGGGEGGKDLWHGSRTEKIEGHGSRI